MSFFVDTHTHSEFSPDSKTTVGDLLLRAKSTGAGGICLTDHLDLDAPRNPGLFEFNIDFQQKEIKEKKHQISDIILKIPIIFYRISDSLSLGGIFFFNEN